MSREDQSARIVSVARSWIGTPYRHQAGTKHVGCDCLGLVVGIWRELGADVPSYARDYSCDWAECAADDYLLKAANTFLIPVKSGEAVAGDVLVFRWSAFSVSKHLAVLSSPTTMVHAFERHSVCEATIVPQWQRRISGVFRFPYIPVSEEK